MAQFFNKARVSIKIQVYETTHKKYYDRVVTTRMTKRAKETFVQHAGGWSEAFSKSEMEATSSSWSASASGSVDVAGSGGSVSASMAMSNSKETQSAVSESISQSWDNAESLSASSEDMSSHEEETSLEFQDGTTQIYALITTTITIGGDSATTREERYLTAGLTEHITADAMNARLRTWEQKAWRDFFHLEKVPARSMLSYELKLPVKHKFIQTRLGRNKFEHLRFITWAPGKFIYTGYWGEIYEVDKATGSRRKVKKDLSTEPWFGIDTGTYYNGKLYIAGCRTADDVDKRKIFQVDPKTGAIDRVIHRNTGPYGKHIVQIAGFNNKLFWATWTGEIDGEGFYGQLFQMELTDGDLKEPTKSIPLDGHQGFLKDSNTMTTSPDALYFTTGGMLTKVDKDDHYTQIYPSFYSQAGMCYSNGSVYCSYGGTSKLDMLDLSGGENGMLESEHAPNSSTLELEGIAPTTMKWICGGPDGVFGISGKDSASHGEFLYHYRSVPIVPIPASRL